MNRLVGSSQRLDGKTLRPSPPLFLCGASPRPASLKMNFKECLTRSFDSLQSSLGRDEFPAAVGKISFPSSRILRATRGALPSPDTLHPLRTLQHRAPSLRCFTQGLEARDRAMPLRPHATRAFMVSKGKRSHKAGFSCRARYDFRHTPPSKPKTCKSL